MKILNLFAGIGGNRTLWDQIPDVEITAVEYDEQIAKIYQKRFPHDTLIVGDAYQYLEEHMDEFDVIWASPPCQSHTRLMVMNVSQHAGKLPDLRLYSIIIYLSRWFKGKYIVENVKPYYDPLIPPKIELDRHYFWTNFAVTSQKFTTAKIDQRWKSLERLDDLCVFFGIDPAIMIDVDKNDINQYIRNCVHPDVGLYLLQNALKPTQRTLI